MKLIVSSIVIATLAASSAVRADGERTPMIGIAALGGELASRTPDVGTVGVFGLHLESAWWLGRFGIAAEGSLRGAAYDGTTYGGVVGASARLRLLDGLAPSLLEPRAVEVALELHAVIERAWWQHGLAGEDGTSYGLGAALRVRGSGGPFTSLLAESRLFVRVMSSPAAGAPLSVERSSVGTPTPEAPSGRGITFLVGLGASWGYGSPAYADRFGLHRYIPPAL